LIPGLDSFLAGPPVGRAAPAGLQALDNSQGFVHAAPDIQVVDHFVLHDAVRVNNEQAAQGDPSSSIKTP
jgi:hypothetical protein